MQNKSQSREIRVFLSSTFKDMEEERNCLIKQVFPKLRKACLSRQVGFTEIDLRWGITEEDAKNGVTVEICLSEIERCRDFPPFFIGFLGERYGWIPREDELNAYWTQHGDSPYAETIRNAVRRGISVTELEMELAVLGQEAAENLHGHALFLLRDRSLTDKIYQETTGRQTPNMQDTAFYDPAGDRLEALKKRIRASCFLGVDGYASIEDFGQRIENYLLEQLERYFPENRVPSPLERTQAAHDAFRLQRSENFLPRSDIVERVRAGLIRRENEPALGPVLLAGPSGQGKSALMAHLASTLQGETADWQIIDHYIGADERNTLDAWVERLLGTLHPEIEDLTGPIPESDKARWETLSTWFAYAARRREQQRGKPVLYLLILDALDQLNDGGQHLERLTPAVLGPDVLLLASAADGSPAQASAQSWETVTVPPLTDELKQRFIDVTLRRYRKELESEHVDRLVQAPQCANPLFLRLALEELRVNARFEDLAARIDNILECPDAERLYLQRFLLDPDYARDGQPDLAARFMAFMAAARQGLSETELANLLALPGDPVAPDTGKPRLPQRSLSALLAAFAPFLLNKAGNRAPMHRLLGEAALRHSGESEIREAVYQHCKVGYGTGWDDLDPRPATEALYQITRLANLESDARTEARTSLLADLCRLWVPVRLHGNAPDVTLQALTSLDEAENAALSERWRAAIEAMDPETLRNVSEAVCVFAKWLRERALDRYRLPMRVLETLLVRQEQALPPDDLKIAWTMNLLGNCFLDLRNLENLAMARDLFERALGIYVKVRGKNDPDMVKVFNNLSFCLEDMGKSEDIAAAREFRERAIDIWEKTLPPGDSLIAHGYSNLALHLQRFGSDADFVRIRDLYERALNVDENALGREHPEVAMICNNLASFLLASDNIEDLTKAQHLFERALNIHVKAFGQNHSDVAKNCGNLALCLKKIYRVNAGENEAASRIQNLYERALNITEVALGPEHPDVAISCNNLAMYLQTSSNAQDFDKALGLYTRALDIRKKAFGNRHPKVTKSRNMLAQYYRDQSIRLAVQKQEIAKTMITTGNLIEAELFQLGATDTFVKELGENSLEAAESYIVMGTLLAKKGDHLGAKNHLLKSLKIYENDQGSHHEVVRILRDLLSSLSA